MAAFIETEGLTKRYGAFTALSDCSLSVEQGEVFGLLGPNGAGKTTLLRLLLGFLRPTSGSARIRGFDCVRQTLDVRRIVAYLPGEARLFRMMRGRDILRFFAEMRPGSDLRRFQQLAERLELDLSRRVAFMSTGMRQKLALAVTLGADAPLVILDEPTANLDPSVRAEVGRLVKEAQAGGKTVVFSSHVLSEVEETCDHVAMLSGGRVVHRQPLSELRRWHRIIATLTGKLPEPPAEFRADLQVRSGADGAVVIETPQALAPLLGWLSTLPLTEMRIEPIGLRHVYDRYVCGE